MRIHGIPVILKISHAVSHGMSVLAQDQRPWIVGQGEFDDFLDGAVHRAVHIRESFQSRVFALYGPGGIALFDPSVHGPKVLTVSRFVPQRPDNDRGMILVPLHHTHRTIHERLSPFGLVGQRLFRVVRIAPVRLDVGFVNQIEAVPVA